MIALFGDDDLDQVVDLNLKGTVYVTRAVSRVMLARRSGSIVNISSVVGLSGYRGLAVYGATKAALDGFTRGGRPGTRVPRHHGQQRRSRLPAHRNQPRPRRGAADPDQPRLTALGRLGEPADVARAVLFLTDPANTFVTGQVVVVDGGLTC